MPKKERFTAEEEAELFRRWREEGDRDAQNRLANSISQWGARLALKFCKQYDWKDYESAFSAANHGVAIAMRRWNPEKGARLITYSTHWIFSKLQREFRASLLIRVPDHWWHGEKSKDPEVRSIIKQVTVILQIVRRKSPTSHDVDEPGTEGSVLDEVVHREFLARLRQRIDKAFLAIGERQADIIRRRIMEEETLEAISQTYGLTRERIRQIEKKSLPRFINWFDERAEALGKYATRRLRTRVEKILDSATVPAAKREAKVVAVQDMDDEIAKLHRKARKAIDRIKMLQQQKSRLRA